MCWSTGWPLWKRTRHGLPLTPYWPGVSGLVSVLTFAIVISLSSAIECRTGEIILQGPHQGAQKSTNTDSDSEITDLKFESDASKTWPIVFHIECPMYESLVWPTWLIYNLMPQVLRTSLSRGACGHADRAEYSNC